MLWYSSSMFIRDLQISGLRAGTLTLNQVYPLDLYERPSEPGSIWQSSHILSSDELWSFSSLFCKLGFCNVLRISLQILLYSLCMFVSRHFCWSGSWKMSRRCKRKSDMPWYTCLHRRPLPSWDVCSLQEILRRFKCRRDLDKLYICNILQSIMIVVDVWICNYNLRPYLCCGQWRSCFGQWRGRLLLTKIMEVCRRCAQWGLKALLSFQNEFYTCRQFMMRLDELFFLEVLQIELQHPLLRNTEYVWRSQLAEVITSCFTNSKSHRLEDQIDKVA